MDLSTAFRVQFIKTKNGIFKIISARNQMNIDKYNKSEILQNIILYEINLTTNLYYILLWFRESFEVNFNIRFGIPIEFPR